MRIWLLCFLATVLVSFSQAQQTVVSGTVRDAETGEALPFVKVRFLQSQIGAITDTAGRYTVATYYATDSLQFFAMGYLTKTVAVKRDQTQIIDVKLTVSINEMDEVRIVASSELPWITLHKKIVANKPINNKEKLLAYDYELYNKMQVDINNIGDKFDRNPLVKRLDLVMDYLDSAENGKNYLPVLLSESISEFYFRNKPKKRKEIITASKITGIENYQLNQLMGDMYLDINIYENNIPLFQRTFISPISSIARSFYTFKILDTVWVGNHWCYHLSFEPKRTGDMTFEGQIWVTDTTYAVKSIQANISPWANINYVQDLYFEQQFEEVEPEVWMLTNEKLIVDLKLTKNTEVYGFFARKTSSRRDFVINQPHDEAFYRSDNTVEYADSAQQRNNDYWITHRHVPLSGQERNIEEMIDSLSETRTFKTVKNMAYFFTTGYYPVGKVEIGNAYNFFSANPVEKLRFGLALRTSNQFSRRIEIGGRIAYGVADEAFKYGATIRYNVTPKKRGMLIANYSKDIEQIGISPTAAAVGSTFGTLFRTGPLDKLTFVEKGGISFEKDVKKDLILFGSFDWKEYTALGIANYQRINPDGSFSNIGRIQTSEVTLRVRWTKDEEFLSGAFDRTSLRSRYPILSLQGIFGIKGLLGSDYNYQKIEFQLEHNRNIGVLGRLRYGATAGYIFGTTAYPFLKVHEGNQSLWLLTSTFNKLNFFEFVSDKYVGAFAEQHWEGLFFDRLPLIKKLKWRLVTTGRIAYGAIDSRHAQVMVLPSFTKQFGAIPYAEAAIGIENIFKIGRVDLVWRLTHLDPGMSPLGIRARWSFGF